MLPRRRGEATEIKTPQTHLPLRRQGSTLMNTALCFAHNDSSLTLQRHARERTHKGGSGAWTVRTYPPPVQHPQPRRAARPQSGPSGLGAGNVACTCDVVRRRFMGRTLLKTAHRRIPAEGISIGGFAFLIPASFACARSLLVPGTCDLPRRRADARERSAVPAAGQAPD